MKKILLIVLVLLSTSFLAAENHGVISEVLKPQSLEVFGDKIYVIEGIQTFIYSIPEVKLITKFGKKGEGPGEVMAHPIIENSVFPTKENIFVIGFNKILYFDLEGKFIREKKKTIQMFRFFPIGKNYVVNRMNVVDQKQFSELVLIDENLKDIKLLLKQEISTRGANLFMAADTISFTVSNGEIYVDNSQKGLVIDVYDSNGKKLRTIEKKHQPLKLTSAHKEMLMLDLKEDPLAKSQSQQVGGWEEFKKLLNLKWPDYFPAIKTIAVSNGKILVQTFNVKGDKTEYLIMDTNGNNMKSVFLPNVKEASLLGRLLGRGIRFWDFDNNKFYYLYENEDEEEWELHSVAVK